MPPVITSITPAYGNSEGGVAVTITGTDFVSGATVGFGVAATPATSVVFSSSTTLTCVTPAKSVAFHNVIVTNPDTNFDTLTDGYESLGYFVISSDSGVSPIPTADVNTEWILDTTVSLDDTHLFRWVNPPGGAAPYVGSIADIALLPTLKLNGAGAELGINDLPAGFTVVEATLCTGVYLSGAASPHTLSFDAFPLFLNPITSSGPVDGMEVRADIEIPITNLSLLAGYTFEFTDSVNNNATNGNLRWFPNRIAGIFGILSYLDPGFRIHGTYRLLVSIWYYNPETDSYTYASEDPGSPWIEQDPTLTITDLSPLHGSECGGTTITITGTGFGAGATVNIGATPATDVVVVSATTITAVTPSGTGIVDVTVINPDTEEATFPSGHLYLEEWWLKHTNITINGTLFSFETWVHQCGAPDDESYVVLGAPALEWFNNPALGAWVWQVEPPSPDWVPSTAPDPNGWYYSTVAFGGNLVIVANGRPKNPRTWANISTFATGSAAMLGGSPASSVTIHNRLIYPSSAYTVGTTAPPIRIFDGNFDRQLVTLPPTATGTQPKAVMSMLAANGTIYLSSLEVDGSSNMVGRVFNLDINAGELTPIGATFAADEVPYALAWHAGRLWCGTNKGDGTAGKIYFFRPNIDTIWTEDYALTAATQGGVCSMLSFQGKLYVGTDKTSAGFAKVLVRDIAGAYTTSLTSTGGAATNNNSFLAMKEFQDSLYVSYWNNDTPAIAKIYAFDGTDWTTAYTGTSGTIRPFIGLTTDRNELFAIGGGLGLTAALLRTANGTSWTDLTSRLPETDKTLLPSFGVVVL